MLGFFTAALDLGVGDVEEAFAGVVVFHFEGQNGVDFVVEFILRFVMKIANEVLVCSLDQVIRFGWGDSALIILELGEGDQLYFRC